MAGNIGELSPQVTIYRGRKDAPYSLEWLMARIAPEPNSGCWLWLGTCCREGYGRIEVDRYGDRKRVLAHRVMYEFHRGPIPPGLQIDHLCRVTCCVNPDHLEPVTPAENRIRALPARGRECRRGHAFTPENTYFRRDGRRRCRICARALGVARRAKEGRRIGVIGRPPKVAP